MTFGPADIPRPAITRVTGTWTTEKDDVAVTVPAYVPLARPVGSTETWMVAGRVAVEGETDSHELSVSEFWVTLKVASSLTLMANPWARGEHCLPPSKNSALQVLLL